MPEDKKEEVKKPEATEPQAKEVPKVKSSKAIVGLVVAVIILAAGCGVLAWQFWQKYDDNKQQASQISALQAELDALKTSTTATPTSIPTTSATNLKTTIAAAINTMNTTALESYMADSVFVIYAATEYAGNRTPAQAVADLDYLSNATPPWNFNLPATLLNGFDAGFYTDYFNPNSIVGMSSDDYVVSFNIDATGLIDGIFICVSSDLLL